MCTGVTGYVQKSIHKKFPLLLTGGEGFGLPSAEKLGVRGGYETALFLGGYTILTNYPFVG
jgi:hypothetical protein